MRAAREAGIAFLDDARYNDETGTAPIPTGYSEVVFGELFRAAGWERDEVVVVEQAVVGVLARAERRRGDRRLARRGWASTISTSSTPSGLPRRLAVHDAVRAVAALVEAGKARAWGVLNWPAARIAEAVRGRRGGGRCRARARRSCPTASCGARRSRTPTSWPRCAAAASSVVASAVMEGGALTGRARAARRPRARRVRQRAARGAARAWPPSSACTPAALAIAFALANPDVASALFGASRPEQIAENVAAGAARRERRAALRGSRRARCSIAPPPGRA